MHARDGLSVPEIKAQEAFDPLVRKLAVFFTDTIDSPHDFEELKRVTYAKSLRPLVKYLVDDVHHEGIVCALLALRWHFSTTEDEYDRGLNVTRSLACEVVAWRFVSHLSQREAIEYLCYELPTEAVRSEPADILDSDETQNANGDLEADERRPLLVRVGRSVSSWNEEGQDTDNDASSPNIEESFATTFAGLNALEIAAVAGAKKFLSEKPIQRIINGIWKGDIVFWDALSTHSVKKPRMYNKDRSDPFCRLRVPLYLKVFEILFFAVFLVFYYVALIEKSSPSSPSVAEIMLYIWLAAFAYNELGEFWDAGTTFYATDFWSSWDLGIIAIGIAFFIARMVGIARDDPQATNAAFDILSVQALFLVPRVCSLLSLHPYFGILLPALKEMTKDFIKFIGLVAIFYIGFDTTFTFLARGSFSFTQMNWILVKVFFGSGYLDIADKISPILGPPLMLVFVCLTNILLITSLIALLSNSLTKVMEHARDEYLFVYSVYVLEAATSNRLTYFLPPLNLLALLLRPLRLVLPGETLRSIRIILLKATHWPFVAMIIGYENGRLYFGQRRMKNASLLHARRSNAPKTLRRTLKKQKPMLATDSRQSLLAGKARSAPTSFATQAVAHSETIHGLEAAIHSLKTQIETISTIVAKKQEASTAHT